MKKLFCILLTLIMVLSLAACGEDESSGGRNNKDNSSGNTTVQREKVEMITDGAFFSDGVAIVAHRSDKEPETKFSVIDKEGYILGDLEMEQDYNLFHPDPKGYINGVLVYGNKVYDKTGKLIASPEKSGYTQLLTDARCDGKILAIKYDENASEKEFCYGLLDNKGNWIEPLSNTHPIAKVVENTDEEKIDLYLATFCTDEIVHIAENCYYNMKTGEITSRIGEFIGKSESVYNGNEYVGEHHEVFYKDKDGNEHKVKDGVYLWRSFETGFIGCYSQNDDRYLNLYYFDKDGNELINLNTDYIMEARVIDGYLFVLRETGRNEYDTCIYKTTGEKVIESLDLKTHFNDFKIWPEYEIFGNEDRNFYNFDGEKIEFEDYMTAGFGDGLFYAVSEDDYHRAYLDINGNRVL